MPPRSAVIVIDFAMNYTCFLQDEVQSYHWAPPQVTIHPCYTYINLSEKVSAPTHTEAIIMISSDLQHDAAAVAKFMSLCSEHLKKCYPGITHMFQFSDCAASQYRCCTSFADISFSQEDLGLQVQRHYFESSHGKSPADGQGAVIKRAATIAVTRREAQIRSAEEFYQFCQEKLTDVGQGVYPSRQREYADAKRTFMFVKSEDINHNRPERQVKPVVGTMTIHCVKASGPPYKIQTRELSCVCDHCLHGVGDECINANTVGVWKNVQLTPKGILFYCDIFYCLMPVNNACKEHLLICS
ncbi:uncharacterized protein [Amphiura filiformis]|uniref:uncharacterized protein n=1 Tax=Amphiura filiformis TaxID=82378 RepID=UPI003B210704